MSAKSVPRVSANLVEERLIRTLCAKNAMMAMGLLVKNVNHALTNAENATAIKKSAKNAWLAISSWAISVLP